MTPQKKAIELYNYYEELIKDFTKGVSIKNLAQECTLKAVDEVIKELTEEISPSVHGFRHKYWQEVKQEIYKIC